jgi:pyruvate/2-oxoglutarate dehydrogenase complex dihydrolipoamide dehydrogenase (E3) component
MGVASNYTKLDFGALSARAETMTDEVRAQELARLDEAGVEVIQATAKLQSAHEISLGTDEVVTAQYVLLATGAVLKDNKIEGVEEAGCRDIGSLVRMRKAPTTALVVGGGSTGCEIAQYLANIGVRVLLAEIAGRLLPREDEEVGQVIDRELNQQKITVLTQTRVTSVESDHMSKRARFVRGGVEHTVRVDEIIIATGETQNIHDLGLEAVKLKIGKNGVVHDAGGRTSVKNIFVAGGARGGGDNTDMRAEREGHMVAKTILGGKVAKKSAKPLAVRTTRLNVDVVQIGDTEDECIKHDAKTRKAVRRLADSMAGGGRMAGVEFVKILRDAKTGFAGATLVGEGAQVAAEMMLVLPCDERYLDKLSEVTPAEAWGYAISGAAKELVAAAKKRR